VGVVYARVLDNGWDRPSPGQFLYLLEELG
jgi:hypothetical protein